MMKRRRLPMVLVLGVLAVGLMLALFSVDGKRAQATAPTVCIDPGHGGGDGGAINETYDLREEEIVLDMAFRLKALLEWNGYGAVLTRTTNEGSPTHWERVVTCREADADLIVSLHLNSYADPWVDGSMMLYVYEDDRELAEAIHSRLYPALSEDPAVTWYMPDLEVRYFNAAILRWSWDRPAVMIEPLMLTHDGEAALMAATDVHSRRQVIVNKVFEGIVAYFNDAPNPTPAPTTAPTTAPEVNTTPEPSAAAVVAQPTAVPQKVNRTSPERNVRWAVESQ